MRNTMTIAVLFFSVVSISGLCFSQSDRCLPPVPHGGGEYEDICDKVVKIDCGGGLLSGFFTTVSGKRGIATALHGVLGCTNLVAFNQVRSFSGLRLEMVNIERDAAFLTSDALQSASIPSLSIQSLDEFDFANEEMFVVGYPQGVAAQISFSLTPHANAIMTLSDILPFNERETLRRRGSPGLAQQVLFLSGSIQHGLSGAPVLSGSGRVIAFADGGLGEGALNINWAIPCRDIPWENASDRRNEIAQLSGESSAEDLFGVRPGAAFKVPPLYLTDARDSKGKIYLFNNGDLSVKYARPRGNIYSLAVSPRGELHFSNHNDANLYLLAKKRKRGTYLHPFDLPSRRGLRPQGQSLFQRIERGRKGWQDFSAGGKPGGSRFHGPFERGGRLLGGQFRIRQRRPLVVEQRKPGPRQPVHGAKQCSQASLRLRRFHRRFLFSRRRQPCFHGLAQNAPTHHGPWICHNRTGDPGAISMAVRCSPCGAARRKDVENGKMEKANDNKAL